MHVHHLQSETVRVAPAASASTIAGEPERLRRPRRDVTFDPGVAHRFWNAGDDELVLDGEVPPPHNLEYFLTQVYASTAAHGGRPGALDAAFLLTRYRAEFAMTAIPAPGPPLRLPDPGPPRPPPRPLRPLRRRPGPGQPPHERYTPRPHDQRP